LNNFYKKASPTFTVDEAFLFLMTLFYNASSLFLASLEDAGTNLAPSSATLRRFCRFATRRLAPGRGRSPRPFLAKNMRLACFYRSLIGR
jgi:hypothetical protein